MSEIKLATCRCGGEGGFAFSKTADGKESTYVICKKCGIRTPEFTASLEFCAQEEAAKIFNTGLTLWPNWQQGRKYKLGEQCTNAEQHWINEKDENGTEPKQSGSGWKLVGPA